VHVKINFTTGLGADLAMWEVADHARVAEESGFTHITFVDQHNISRDVCAMMTVAAMSTRRIHIGQGVSYPVALHPSAIASAAASIDEISGGRAFLGIGAGGAGAVSMGLKPSPLKNLRNAVEFIRKYMVGEEAEFKGVRMQSEWIKQPVPIYMAAAGPRSLQLAGEISDGIMITGAHPELLKWRLEQIERGAERIGRDPSEIDIWARALCCISESKEAARRETSSYAAMVAKDTYLSVFSRKTPEGSDLMERLEKLEPGIVNEFKTVYENFGPYQNERTDAPHAQFVTQRLIDMTMLTGTPEDVCEAIEKIGELGIKTISCVMFSIIDQKGMMRLIADKVMPHFRN